MKTLILTAYAVVQRVKKQSAGKKKLDYCDVIPGTIIFNGEKIAGWKIKPYMTVVKKAESETEKDEVIRAYEDEKFLTLDGVEILAFEGFEKSLLGAVYRFPDQTSVMLMSCSDHHKFFEMEPKVSVGVIKLSPIQVVYR